MVLEATMIVVDNSESSRNGDYPPSRWEAQRDAANLIFHSKTQSNPESSVGLLSMAGAGPEVLTTLTTNPGKVLDGLHRTKIRGDAHFYTGIMIASLALKHRQNKSQRQRIVVFVCSKVGEAEGTLVKLGKKMRKIGVSVDVVAFGDLSDENREKLRAFNEAVKGGDGSTLEFVDPGPGLLSDAIVASSILAGEGGVGAAAAAQAGARVGRAVQREVGISSLGLTRVSILSWLLVLRMSMEEERERQAREQRARDEAEGRTNLESVPEEGEGSGESQPLLQQQDGSGEGSSGGEKKEEDKKDGDDKMDTA